jgi:hypothetical protein
VGKYSVEKGRRKAGEVYEPARACDARDSWHRCSGDTVAVDIWISAFRHRLDSSLALYPRTDRSPGLLYVMVGRKKSKFGVKSRMRRITNSLAVLLSLLMAASSVSASSCDLTCWLRRAHSECHSVGPAGAVEVTAMSMSGDRDMGSGRGESVAASDTNMNSMSGHSMSSDMGPGRSKSMSAPQGRLNARPDRAMSMFPQMEMVPKRFVSATQPKTRRADHSTPLSPCTHEPCSQVSASTSPPSGSQSQCNPLHRAAIVILSPLHLRTSFHWIKLGVPPPKLLTADRLTTILKI